MRNFTAKKKSTGSDTEEIAIVWTHVQNESKIKLLVFGTMHGNNESGYQTLTEIEG